MRCQPGPNFVFTMQIFLDTGNYNTNVFRVRKLRYQSWLGHPRRLCEQIRHVIGGKTGPDPESPRVTCDSRDREYGTFLTRFLHARFFQYESYEFQESRYECAPSSKNAWQKRSSSNFGFTACFTGQKTVFLIFDTFFEF